MILHRSWIAAVSRKLRALNKNEIFCVLSTFCYQFSDGDTEYSEDEEDFDTPKEADRVYVLMKKDYRLSRNSRAKWYLKHLIPRHQHGQAANTATPGLQDADRGDNFKIRKYQSIEDMPR